MNLRLIQKRIRISKKTNIIKFKHHHTKSTYSVDITTGKVYHLDGTYTCKYYIDQIEEYFENKIWIKI